VQTGKPVLLTALAQILTLNYTTERRKIQASFIIDTLLKKNSSRPIVPGTVWILAMMSKEEAKASICQENGMFWVQRRFSACVAE